MFLRMNWMLFAQVASWTNLSEDRHTRQRYLDMMATLQRRHSINMRLFMKLLTEWQTIQPHRQAEALPREVTFAMAVAAVWRYNAPDCAVHFILCFCGLLRIGESLALQGALAQFS